MNRNTCSRTARLCILGLIGCAAPNVGAAGIFVYTADDGVISLSNQPEDSRYEMLISDEPPGAGQPPARSVRQAGTSRGAARLRFEPIVAQAAAAHGLESSLLHAVISVESGYNPGAVSPKGAQGLMQLMPATASRYGVADALDPQQNVLGGAKYLRDLLNMFNSNVQLALAAYNAGENAVVRYGNRIPPYRETADYVPKVLRYYQQYRSAGGNP